MLPIWMEKSCSEKENKSTLNKRKPHVRVANSDSVKSLLQKGVVQVLLVWEINSIIRVRHTDDVEDKR